MKTKKANSSLASAIRKVLVRHQREEKKRQIALQRLLLELAREERGESSPEVKNWITLLKKVSAIPTRNPDRDRWYHNIPPEMCKVWEHLPIEGKIMVFIVGSYAED